MSAKRRLPASVAIVAWLFIFAGIMAASVIVASPSQALVSYIPMGLVALPAGAGLLKLSNNWRLVALILIWMGMIVAVILAISIGTNEGALKVKAGMGALITVFLWMNWVLTRHEVRELFSD